MQMLGQQKPSNYAFLIFDNWTSSATNKAWVFNSVRQNHVLPALFVLMKCEWPINLTQTSSTLSQGSERVVKDETKAY